MIAVTRNRMPMRMGVVLSVLLAACATAEDPVYFADANLKAAVEAALGKTNPTPTDMFPLGELHIQNSGIKDITGLEYATNLASLWAWDNQISDLSSLAGLTRLRYLYLDYCQYISDLTPLSGLTQLTHLSLEGNQISQIGALASLTNLCALRLEENRITDISVLANLTNLISLRLHTNQVGDISPLASLTSLSELLLNSNDISDISAVASLTNLNVLDLSGNQISDISPLLNLTNLTELYLDDNQIGDLSSLASLTRLTILQVQDNRIGDISSLTSLTSLERLCLENNQISDISPLLNLTGLRILLLRGNPLDTLAHRMWIPKIKRNNPDIYFFWYDPPVWRTLSISSAHGGSVLTPGEDQFQFVGGEVVSIEAAPAGASYTFSHWRGSAVDASKVADPSARKTTVLVDGDYTLEAVFVERAEGPVLGFSAGEIDVDDPNEYYYRVGTNNTPEATFVERVTGVEPDPNGMVRMQVIEGEPARAKGRFGRCSAERVLVRFQYLFETADATEIVVYLSDVPQLLDHSDPAWSEHYIEIGRVPAPCPGCPGAFGSGRFGVFEEWAFVGGLDLSGGTWVELELVDAGHVVLAKGGIHLASGGTGGSAVFDALSVQVHCSGYCLDLNFTKTVDSEDLLLVMAGCGSTAELDRDSEGSRYCLDGAFSSDGYVDAYDIHSLIWALSDLSRVDCGSLCRVPLPLTDTTVGIAASGYSAASFRSVVGAAGLGPWPAGMMILYKNRTDDLFCLFDAEGTYVTEFTAKGLPVQGAAQIVRGAGDTLYVVSTEEGVLRIDDPVESIIPPAEVSFNSATVYIGIQGNGSGCFGRPIFDVAFDAQGYAYVAPIVVEVGQEAYVSAAKLELLDGQSPPYRVVNLYDDPAPANDNRRRNHLREIEIDGTGNVYVANIHRLNESCILWKYAPDGTLLKRLSLLDPNSSAKIEDPVGLHISDDGKMLYLACGQQDRQHPGRSTLYGLSTQDLSLIRTITIEGMPVVTSITQDPATGTLWATGYSTAKIQPLPFIPAKFTYTPQIAEIPANVDIATAKDIVDPGGAGLAVPTCILWTGNE